MVSNKEEHLQTFDSKYAFYEYDSSYPALAASEINRIKQYLPNDSDLQIEHVGSSAVPGLGGKNYIDIYFNCAPDSMQRVSRTLVQAGYDMKLSGGEKGIRIFHQRTDETGQNYHAHVTNNQTANFDTAVKFRDYLRQHPDAVAEYQQVKKEAVLAAAQETTQKAKKQAYLNTKSGFIESIIDKLQNYSE